MWFSNFVSADDIECRYMKTKNMQTEMNKMKMLETEKNPLNSYVPLKHEKLLFKIQSSIFIHKVTFKAELINLGLLFSKCIFRNSSSRNKLLLYRFYCSDNNTDTGVETWSQGVRQTLKSKINLSQCLPSSVKGITKRVGELRESHLRLTE